MTVSLIVELVNDTPVAENDAFAIAEDNTLTVLAAAGVLANDSDPDSVETAVLVTDVSDGTLTLNADGSFTYTPDANFDGADSFTYRAVDGNTQSALATVTIDLTPVNDAPVAVADAYSGIEDVTLTRNAAAGVLANDSDIDSASPTVTLMIDVTDGTLTLNADGSFSYVPDSDFEGSDSFTYRASDGALDSATVAVNLTIGAVNDLPVAVADAYTISEDGTLDITAGVLLNDTDIESANLTAELVTNVAHGTLTLDADGTFLYQPAADYFGPDTFQYRAHDGADPSSAVTVAIDVTPVNDAPTVPVLQSPPGGSVVEPDAVSFIWLASSDVEDDAFSYLVELSKDGAVVSNLPSTGTTVSLAPGTTLADGSYSWRVQASDATDDSAFSAPFTFDVGVGDGGGSGGGGCGCSIEARARPSLGAALIAFAAFGLVVRRRR